MNKWYGCLWASLLYSRLVLGQGCTVSDIKEQIPHIYRIIEFPIAQNKSQLISIVDTISPTYSLSKLINNHPSYVSYLSSKYSVINSTDFLIPNISLKQANENYHQALAKDTVFNRHFLTMSYFYLKAQGITVKGIKLDKKQTVTMPTLLRIATRFFERLEAVSNGRIVWHLNQPSIAQSDYDPVAQNQPLIEAFCNEVVMNWSYTEEWSSFPYDQEFYTRVQDLMMRTAQFKNADDKRTLVRPAMRELMTKSKILEKILIEEYQRSQDWLSFELIQ